MNNPLDHIVTFNLLNIEGRKQVINHIRSLLDIVINIVYFGSPSKAYMKGLVEIAGELVECMFLDDANLFPQIKRDSTFLNILDRFNKLQKNEERQVLNTMNRIYSNKILDFSEPTIPVVPPKPPPAPPTTKP
jgi:hypothetical protein